MARLWNQIHPRGSERWNELVDELVELGLTIDPTMTIYAAGRDLMRRETPTGTRSYTLPSQWDFFQPSRESHGAYWFYWTATTRSRGATSTACG